MLRELHIKNIAVIEEVTIAFGDGFHVLTGETGAGKSILIDSINMALGERTTKELIRTGTDTASVDLVFEPDDAVTEKLSSLGIDTEEGMLYISRQISSDGKSKCRINGRMVPLSLLKEAAAYLITIHGQNDNQSILSPKTHLHFVDVYGNYPEILEEYKNQYDKVQALTKKLAGLMTDEAEKAHRMDLLTYQIQEISDAGLKAGEEEELMERQEYLSHFEQIMENGSSAYESLYGDEEMSAYDRISDAVSRLEHIHPLDAKLDGFYQTLHGVLADLEDVTHEMKSYMDRIDFQPGELETIGDRLAQISGLKRKYGGSVENILSYLQNAREELSAIENSEAQQEALKAELAKENAVLERLAFSLSEKRKEAAISLQTRIMEELSDLDMQKMRFSVCVEQMEEEDGSPRYTSTGCDRIEFLISGNPGEALKPLAKIASGGEMSRIMLAVKSVLADGDIVKTLIFDEIDTGVSGRAAQKIAEKICMLAKNHQILCITHLAQIASMADTHFLIEKTSDAEHTRTSVIPLDTDMRKQELARIIGGVKITELTLQAAQEMLDMAKTVKERR